MSAEVSWVGAREVVYGVLVAFGRCDYLFS